MAGRPADRGRRTVKAATSRQHKPPINARELKSFLPSVDVIAKDLYSIEFRNNIARCPHLGNHKNGDRDPSLRHDRRKNRIFCASQNCFGEKGADAFKFTQVMDNCSFPEALRKLNSRYGHQPPELLDYALFCHSEVNRQMPRVDFEAPSGFYWLTFSKFELQLYNLRHLAHHTGQLADRLHSQANLGVAWVR